MLLSIIIPFFNEPTLMAMLTKLYEVNFPNGLNIEVIAVDDGSTDGSTAMLENCMEKFRGLILMKHNKNKGKGAAIKTGLSVFKGDIVIIQDADLEYCSSDIPKVIQPIIEGKTKVCYGSRHLDRIQKGQNILWLRKHLHHSFLAALGGRTITWLFNLLYHAKITDAPTCYNAFSSDFINNISLVNDGFDLKAELTAKTLKKTKIMEVPIQYNPRTKRKARRSDYMTE